MTHGKQSGLEFKKTKPCNKNYHKNFLKKLDNINSSELTPLPSLPTISFTVSEEIKYGFDTV